MNGRAGMHALFFNAKSSITKKKNQATSAIIRRKISANFNTWGSMK